MADEHIPPALSPLPQKTFRERLFAVFSLVKNAMRSFVASKKKVGIVVLAGVLVVAGIVASRNEDETFSFQPQYAEVYALVADKISINAPIVVRLPEGVEKAGMEEKVIFTPALKGSWIETNLPDTIAFKPDRKLEVGNYYGVALTLPEGEIRKDFQADENPEISEIFPSAGSEADESSAITIVFNRPMVPLTTLSALEEKDIPISITPQTAGRFKWISTRSLQFIPQTTLVRSANYKISVGQGLTSIDGLSVKGREHIFSTRPIRFEGSTSGQIRYNEPIEIRFNMPVDIAKTRQQLSLSDRTTGTPVEIDVSYGTAFVYDQAENKYVRQENRAIISILPKKDRFGRPHLWDFEHQYALELKKAFPEGGDIIYGEKILTDVTVTNIIKDLVVTSERTPLASPTLFDPKGKVTISFYEDIDLKRSEISAKGLSGIVYGEKCAEENERGRYGSCKRIEDRSVLILSFDDSALKQGEQVPISFQRIVNAEGLTINAEPMSRMLLVYPSLAIRSMTPAQGSREASLSSLVVCTNSPLQPKSGEAFRKAVTSDQYLVHGRWNSPYLQTNDYYQRLMPCAVGEYVNVINYGLHPDTAYTLSLALEDVFGGTVSRQLSFTTEPAPKLYYRFHMLDKVYNVTTPDKTTLTFATENFDAVTVHICKVEPLTMVRYLYNRPLQTTPGSDLACVESVTKTIQLPDRLWVNNYFQVKVSDYFEDPRGEFVLSFSNPKYTTSSGAPLFERSFLSVTRLAVGEKRVNWTKYDTLPNFTKEVVDSTDAKGALYWVSKIQDLSPVSGATVSVVQNTGYAGVAPQIKSRGTTNAEGIATFPLVSDIVGAVVESGADSAVVSSWTDALNYASGANTGSRIYVYTDRPIYRPGQEVHIKGIHRFTFDGSYKIADRNVTVAVTDSQGNSVLSQKIRLNAFGTFSSSFTLPTSASLGGYWISVGDYEGYGSFSVEEYVGSAFEASAKSSKDEYIAGDEASVELQGKYYFGVALDGGTVEYSWTAQNYYFDRYTDEYFSFGRGWYGCYSCGYGDSFIKSGRTTLDAEGKAVVTERLDFESLFREEDRSESKIVVLHATIKDRQGKSVSVQKSFIVHRGEFYLGVKAEPSFAGRNQPFTIRAKTVTTEGKPVKKGDLSLTIGKVEWQSFKRQEVDGNYYNRTERVVTPVITKEISTNGNGAYEDEVALKDAGEYEISLTGSDGRGNQIVAKSFVYIYGEGSVSVRPTNNAELDIQAERRDLKAGETGTFLFRSPYNVAKALITLERGRIFSYKIIDVKDNVIKYDFTAKGEHVPNVFASVLLLSSLPEVKFGQVEFSVNRDLKKLNINVTPDKSAYLPGEKVILSITTTDSSGTRVPSEVSVAVADLSVLALKGNPKKDPLQFFYGGLELSVVTGTNLKNVLMEATIPTGTKGGGGSNPADLSKKQRGEFKDTAFWRAEVETNANGEGTVSFLLPDNLTRWQIETLGITKDSKVGVSYGEITSKKEVMLVPLKPRFIVPGDTFEIGAQVFNQTAWNQTLEIAFESPTLVLLEGKKTMDVKIKRGETRTIFFKVQAPTSVTSGKHLFTLSAENEGYTDSVRNEIPVRANHTYEAVATSGVTDKLSIKEYLYLPETIIKDKGELTIKTSATLAVFLGDALKYLVQFPYGCSEQMASTLSSLAIVQKGLAIENVGDKFALPPIEFDGVEYTIDDALSVGLARIYDSQSSDGGFSYYKGLESDLYLTIAVVHALEDIRGAGHTVRPDVLNSARAYIVQTLQAGGVSKYGLDGFIAGAYAVSRSPSDVPGLSSMQDTIVAGATKTFVNERAGSTALGYLALLAVSEEYPRAFIDRVFTALQNRVTIDARGAYVKTSSDNPGWQLYETPIKSTALFLSALSKDQRAYSETDKLLRFLLSSRDKNGSWGSTQNTRTVISSFTDYLSWKKETKSDFSLKVLLSSAPIAEFDFNKATILMTYEKILPVSSLQIGKLQPLSFEKTNRNDFPNTFYYDMSLKYYLPVEFIAPRDEGITIERNLFRLTDREKQEPVYTATVGEVLKGKLTITSAKVRHQFAVEDFIPAGFELVNFNLSTESETELERVSEAEAIKRNASVAQSKRTPAAGFLSKLFRRGEAPAPQVFSTQGGGSRGKLYPDFQGLRDDRLFLFKQELLPGQYEFEYYIRATTPGTFNHLPAVGSELYYPENFGRTGGALFHITQ